MCDATGCPIAYGLCHCGCGAATALAAETKKSRGNIKGQPVRYISGHFSRTQRRTETVCSVDGCERPRERRDWCPAHYWRWKQHGDVLWVPYRTVEDRFWSKVDKNGPVPARCPELGPCWMWTAGLDTHGYGNFSGVGVRNGVKGAASRFSWLLAHPDAALTPKLFVCHRCDTPPCVRPDHLFLDDHVGNMADMVAKGRARPRGRNAASS